ncbi:MAG TPA: copper resistance CopC family protein, partial [Thermomicrobiales bacterium]|nr:copper resistance CopC family protein [Thermomicrobiales bacterium]
MGAGGYGNTRSGAYFPAPAARVRVQGGEGNSPTDGFPRGTPGTSTAPTWRRYRTNPVDRPLGLLEPLLPLVPWLLALLLFALVPWPVRAEPRLVGSVPEEDATVGAAPAQVELFFLEPVPAIVASLIDQEGGATPLAATVDPAGAQRVVAPLPDGLGDGVWTIGWSVPDAEGRPVAGTLAFRVGGQPEPGAAVVDGRWPAPWAVALRWLAAAGAAVAAGVALLGLVGRRAGASLPGAAAVLAAAGATVALLATLGEPLAFAAF